MVRTVLIPFAVSCVFALPAAADEAKQSKPIDRGYGQHDACFGDKYEKEDDLKTGNEAAVMEILKQMLGPGS